ncbi:hypothetical protein AB1K83_13125 [Sporosarcina sp. 179-K 3D1 HS]|uniref:hypothetical protein n=1 Tax=Sporosarcina sp. 179-K 3D1 HS TaxID=3232169 RepID=UPI00399FF304
MNFIQQYVNETYGPRASEVYEMPLIQYLVKKTGSVKASSKARGSFANLYALYVLIEDYVDKGFMEKKKYADYEGMMFSDAFKRQRELPFGEKLQNHALNSRCNDEFRKFFTSLGEVPITRNLETKRYWINEKLLKKDELHIAKDVLAIIDRYVELKLENFNTFFDACVQHKENYKTDPATSHDFIVGLLNPMVDARIFEIVSFCLTKFFYDGKTLIVGESKDTLTEVPVTLYKTGRTNANDGGIDFIMKPLGRIFQVTEVLDFKKYFLDIAKVNYFPVTFVVKTELKPEEATERIMEQANILYPDESVRVKYTACFEEIITIPTLKDYLETTIKKDKLGDLLDELILQCKVEYNLE